MLILQAIVQTSPPAELRMSGPLWFTVLWGVILCVPISLVLIWRYRRAVSKLMRSGTRPLTTEAPQATGRPTDPIAQTLPAFPEVDRAPSTHAPSAARELYAEVRRDPWRVAAIYVVAGSCFALIMASATLASADVEFLPIRFLVLFWIYTWPIVLSINLIASSTWNAKLTTVIVYFLVLAFLAVVATLYAQAPIWMTPAAWLLFNFLPTLSLLAFLNRKVRAVGPLVLIFLMLALAGPQILILAALNNDRFAGLLVDIGHPLGLGPGPIIWLLVLLGFVATGPLGWLTLRWIKGRYEGKRISDQSITLDAIWLLFGFQQSLSLAYVSAGWLLAGVIAFLVYKIITWLGFSLIKGEAVHAKPNARLLLLRVFSLGKRSERLFDALAKQWRHVGSIQLIAGADLAKDNLEPHEFLDFVSAKLARRFIDSPATLDLKIAEMDCRRDQDGRFRVNELFCHDDTWKNVLSRLVNESDAVLMDLRGFTPENAGCIHEITELINLVPLTRIQFIVDNTTNEPFLFQCLQDSWGAMKPTSPNRSILPAPLRLFHFTGSGMGDLRTLLLSLCVAAKST